MEKLYLTGDGTVWATDAYFQAVTEGIVSETLSQRSFLAMAEHEWLFSKDDESYVIEAATSGRKIALLFKDESKEQVMREYFGDGSKR